MTFSLSPHLNVKEIKIAFQQDNRVQIPNAMPTAQLEQLYHLLHTNLIYDQALILNNQAQLLSQKSIKNFSSVELKQLLQSVYQQASQGIGFWYGRTPDSEKSKPLLVSFKNWLQSAEVLNFVKNITGQDHISSTVVQYTRYVSGDFLTRHKDLGAENNRKIAFVLHLSPQWHPDWGGLLQFYQQNGRPRDAWAPAFGSLHLFNTEHIHAVTSITAFAPVPRYSISGWFVTS